MDHLSLNFFERSLLVKLPESKVSKHFKNTTNGHPKPVNVFLQYILMHPFKSQMGILEALMHEKETAIGSKDLRLENRRIDFLLILPVT